MAFFFRGGCSVHCVGWQVGLAQRIVPSVEQADSAISALACLISSTMSTAGGELTREWIRSADRGQLSLRKYSRVFGAAG